MSDNAQKWEMLKDPMIWQVLAMLAAVLGHPVAASRIPAIGAAFGAVAGVVGPHPEASGESPPAA